MFNNNTLNSTLNNIKMYIYGLYIYITNVPAPLLISWIAHIFFSYVWVMFDPFYLGFQQCLNINIFDLNLNFGIDGLSLFFIYLVSFLLPLCLINVYYNNSLSFSARRSYGIALLSISFLLIVVFYTLDILVFYIFFEGVLIPFFAYIGISGYKKRRIHAAFLFFFYTLFGSLFMLVSIFSIYLHTGTTDIELLWLSEFNNVNEHFIWLAFFYHLL